MSLLDVVGITKKYGEDRVILEDVSFQIQPRQKIGLIGANGAGKSTLFRLLTGDEDPESGRIQHQKETRIGYLEQHACRHPSRTAMDEALTVFEPLILLEEQLNQIQLRLSTTDGILDDLVKKQFRLQEEYDRKGGFVFRSKTRAALLGMGFSEEDLSRPVAQMSGGQKTRIALVKLLLSEVNLLLLDEPTNHLDLFSCRWLEEYLQSYNGAVLLISHDRYLLDRITDTTIEIEYRHAQVYPGGYTRAMEIKEERRLAEVKRNETLTKEIKRMEESVAQFRQWGREKSIKRARNMEKAVDRLKTELTKVQDMLHPFSISFDVDRVSGNDVLRIEKLSKCYGENLLFSNFNLLIRQRERVFLLGPNGCGKTTLFKILTGEETADLGMFRFGAQVSVGYYQQSLLFEDETKTIFDEVHDAFPMLTNTEVRNALGRFLFRGEDVFKKVGTLSGGERARVHLLKLMLKRPNFLLLDEPTNHLDIASKEVIEQALSDFDGTLFVVSHDRYFINKLADRILYMESGCVSSYFGGYDYFLEHHQPAEVERNSEDVPTRTVVSYKEQKEAKAAHKKCLSDIRKSEECIGVLEEEIETLKNETQAPELASDYVRLLELTENLRQKTEELELLYTEWEALQLRLQEFEQE